MWLSRVWWCGSDWFRCGRGLWSKESSLELCDWIGNRKDACVGGFREEHYEGAFQSGPKTQKYVAPLLLPAVKLRARLVIRKT